MDDYKILLMSFVLVVMGCTQNIMVTPENREKYMPDIKESGEKYPGKVILDSGEEIPMDKLRVGVDSIFFRNKYSDEKMGVFIREVKEINFKMSGKGAMEGLSTGILVGGLLGFTIGFASGDDPSGLLSFTAEEKGALLGLTLGIAGGLIGTIGGAASGSRGKYIFTKIKGDKAGQKDTRVLAKKARKSHNFYQLEDVQIYNETDDDIEINWRGRKARLPRDQIRIVRSDSQITLYVQEDISNQKFR